MSFEKYQLSDEQIEFIRETERDVDGETREELNLFVERNIQAVKMQIQRFGITDERVVSSLRNYVNNIDETLKNCAVAIKKLVNIRKGEGIPPPQGGPGQGLDIGVIRLEGLEEYTFKNPDPMQIVPKARAGERGFINYGAKLGKRIMDRNSELFETPGTDTRSFNYWQVYAKLIRGFIESDWDLRIIESHALVHNYETGPKSIGTNHDDKGKKGQKGQKDKKGQHKGQQKGKRTKKKTRRGGAPPPWVKTKKEQGGPPNAKGDFKGKPGGPIPGIPKFAPKPANCSDCAGYLKKVIRQTAPEVSVYDVYNNYAISQKGGLVACAAAGVLDTAADPNCQYDEQSGMVYTTEVVFKGVPDDEYRKKLARLLDSFNSRGGSKMTYEYEQYVISLDQKYQDDRLFQDIRSEYIPTKFDDIKKSIKEQDIEILKPLIQKDLYQDKLDKLRSKYNLTYINRYKFISREDFDKLKSDITGFLIGFYGMSIRVYDPILESLRAEYPQIVVQAKPIAGPTPVPVAKSVRNAILDNPKVAQAIQRILAKYPEGSDEREEVKDRIRAALKLV